MGVMGALTLPMRWPQKQFNTTNKVKPQVPGLTWSRVSRKHLYIEKSVKEEVTQRCQMAVPLAQADSPEGRKSIIHELLCMPDHGKGGK